MAALFQHFPAGNQARSPFVFIRAVLPAIVRYVLLGNPVHDRANSRPHASSRTHGARLMRGIKNKVRQIPAIPAGYVFKSFQLHVLNARSGSFNAIPCAGNHHLAFADHTRNHRSNWIVPSVASAFGFLDSQLHKLLPRFVRVCNHLCQSNMFRFSPT